MCANYADVVHFVYLFAHTLVKKCYMGSKEDRDCRVFCFWLSLLRLFGFVAW